MAREYSRDFNIVDDRTLTPTQAARIWRVVPEELRHGLMNLLYRADEPLHDEVLRLTAKHRDAGTPARSRAGGASCARPATTEGV